MKIKTFTIGGLMLLEPKIFEDERGYFFESYNQKAFEEAGINAVFVQDNQSMSSKGVLRGLHFQNPPYAQGKLVRVLQGAVKDVAVDIRQGSPTYGQYVMAELTGRNKQMMWIPPGFAHGFLTIEDNTIFQYKCTNLYNKESESGIRWSDELLNINWGIEHPVVSEKDQQLPAFELTENHFML